MAKVKIQGNASGTGVLTVTAPNTSTDRTITLPDSSGTILDSTSTLDATKLSGDLPAISAASLTNVPKDVTVGGRKNMLYNGDMRVAQRGTSFDSGTSTIYTLDRWRNAIGSSFNLDTTITQSTTVPSGEGFKYSLKVEADSVVSTSSGQNGGIMQILESQDVQRLAYGTSNAKSLTLSFWTRSNKTGTYCVQLQTNIGNSTSSNRYSHIKEYTINSANTWEKKTLTFSGHTGQAIDSADTNDALRINWWLASDAADNQTANTWNQVASFGSTSNQVNFMDSASNEWYLTGCQLEVGTTATDFEYKTYGEELALCQRYYQEVHRAMVLSGYQNGSSQVLISFPLTCALRAAPSVSYSQSNIPAAQAASPDFSTYNYSSLASYDWTFNNPITSVSMNLSGWNGNDDDACFIWANNTMSFDSEL